MLNSTAAGKHYTIYHAPYAAVDTPTAPAQNIGNDFYAYIANTHSRLNLENRSNNVQLATANSYDPRQIWHFIHLGNSQYEIINMYDSRCLDTNGAGVQVLPYAGTAGQKWSICGNDGYSSSTLYYIVPPVYSTNHGLVLDVVYGSAANVPTGTNVGLGKSWFGGSGSDFVNGGPFHKAQAFQIIKIDSNIIGERLSYNIGSDFYARVGYGDYYLEASGVVTDNDTNMDVQATRSYQDDPKQIWDFIRKSNGSYKIVNEYSGWTLDVSNYAANNVKVRMWYLDNDTLAQQWYPIKSPGETTTHLASGLLYPWSGQNALFSLAMPSSVYDGTQPVIWQQNHEATQQFNISTASYTRPSKPTAPQNIQVIATSSGTTITWDAVPVVSQYDNRTYQIYLTSDNQVFIPTTTTVTGTSYTSNIVLPEGEYFVGVRAVNTKYSDYRSGYGWLDFSIAQTHTVSVSATEGGTASGGGTCQDGASITVTAVHSDGYHFVRWTESGSEVSTSDTYTFAVNADRELLAVFEQDAPLTPVYSISVSASPSEGGSVTGGGDNYEKDASVTVIATPNTGYTFKEWMESGSPVSTDATYTFPATADRTLVAVFELEQGEQPPAPTTYSVSVNASPSAGGTVTGGGSYAEGTSVTVMAVANSGYQFKGWTENGSQVSPNATYTFNINANHILTAVFEKIVVPTYTVNISASPSAGGTVTGSGTYPSGTSVTVRATANNDYQFVGWQSGGSQVSSDATYTFDIRENLELVAVFEKKQTTPQPLSYSVDVSASPAEGGSVSGDGVFTENTSVTVTATANSGYKFVRWVEGGTSVSTNANYTFIVTENRTLTAVFELETPDPAPTYTISVNANPTAGGTVTGGNTYQSGDPVTITATPNDGYKFIEWRLGDSQISTTASYTFTASATQTYTAIFEKVDTPTPPGPTPTTYTISVNASPVAGGTVTGGNVYEENASVTVTATANDDYQFVKWTEGGDSVSTDASYTFTAQANRTLTAVFEKKETPPTPPAPKTYTITVSANPSAGGTVSGGGSYRESTSVTVTATANSGYRFTGWVENGSQVSTSATYTFTINADRSLEARFSYIGSSSSNNQSTGSTSTTPSIPVSTTETNTGATTTASPTASIKGDTATSVITSTIAAEIIKQAVAGSSENVIISPVINGNVTRTEVSIPAATLEEIGRKTDADVTISTPVADVTIPSSGLSDLSSGSSVTVTTQRTENAVELTITAGGKTVENISGGVGLTVPVEDTTPGTVAVIVKEDGTRQVVRKSVAHKNTITVPLDGSARLVIIDNAKTFVDVPGTSWAADAVAFVSGHELFNGTSRDTFSPDSPMTRGMLAVVLHNLENNPEQIFSGAFSDVSGGTWYSDAVTWAAERGIVSGYGNGLFGPGDNITREQLAVMLWRYAGAPAATDKELHFNDADTASGYAVDALRWATENGIINGKGGGILDPKGLATRAQVAQMLMNYLR